MDNYLSIFENNELKKINDYNNYKITYNEEQLKFINSPIENSKLLGIPGGGKTQSIIGKVIHHYIKSDINQNNQFLILTFSRRACLDFIDKGKKQNRILFNKSNIRTLHSLSGKIVYQILNQKASSQDTVIVSSMDLIDNYPEAVLEMTEFCNLKVIFVDEAQDISNIQYQFLLKISKLTNCFLCLIGDPNQNIYQFQNGSDIYLLNHDGPTYMLIKNYRSTPHIVNFVNHFRPWKNLTPLMISTKDDNDPYNKIPIIFTGSIEEIVKDIINKIINSPFPKEQIAIIGPVKKSKPYNDYYTNIGLSLFTNLLDEYNIKFIKHYEDTNKEETDFNELKRKPDHINLFTIHGSKGLEFHQVFLINFHTTTFGIVPSEEKYKEFKYLWYVGLSRASYDLNIYIDKTKIPWNELKECSNKLYVNENIHKPQFVREIKFQEEINPIYNTVTEILNSKKLVDDKTLFDLENIFKYEIETIPIFETNLKEPIKDYKEYSALYGCLIENAFNFYYNLKFKKCPDYIIRLEKIINNTIIIPKNLISGYKILKIRCPFIAENLVKLKDFAQIKNKFRLNEEDVYIFLCDKLNHNYQKEFFLDCENDVIKYSKSDLEKSISFLKNEILNGHINNKITMNTRKTIEHILNLTIYYYQLNHETAYLWKVDFKENIDDLEPYIFNIIKFASNINEEFQFHPTFKHSKLPIVGELDMKNESKIVDIKFTNNLSTKHILQIILYQHIINPNFDKNYELELWNFHLGNIYKIKLKKEDIDIFKLLKLLSKAINKKLENMIFFYNLITSGETYAHKKIDIIDRHFEEYSLNIVPSSGLLKPFNVPFIPFEVQKSTGITKEMVYETGDDLTKFKKEIEEILDCCFMPIFITHNMNYFDHKLFSQNKCKLIDSKNVIRLFLNDIISEKSLTDIFHYLFNSTPALNRAQINVKMLKSIFRKLNIEEDKIIMR